MSWPDVSDSNQKQILTWNQDKHYSNIKMDVFVVEFVWDLRTKDIPPRPGVEDRAWVVSVVPQIRRAMHVEVFFWKLCQPLLFCHGPGVVVQQQPPSEGRDQCPIRRYLLGVLLLSSIMGLPQSAAQPSWLSSPGGRDENCLYCIFGEVYS
jgi:hypothetical protein